MTKCKKSGGKPNFMATRRIAETAGWLKKDSSTISALRRSEENVVLFKAEGFLDAIQLKILGRLK